MLSASKHRQNRNTQKKAVIIDGLFYFWPMTIKDIFSLAIRLMGIYFIFILITDLPTYLIYILSNNVADAENQTRLIAIFVLFFNAAFVYLCLIKANDMAELIIGKAKPEFWNRQTALKIDKDSITYFTVIFAGVWLVVFVIPDLAHYILENFAWQNAELQQTTQRKLYLDFAYYGLRLFTGLALIYFNKPFVTYILQRANTGIDSE